jgi:hypothetical protein
VIDIKEDNFYVVKNGNVQEPLDFLRKETKSALWSSNRRVRMDSLSLICQPKKLSAEVNEIEINYFKNFLIHNMASASPNFRSKLFMMIDKFLKRLKDSINSLSKDLALIVSFLLFLFFSFLFFFFFFFLFFLFFLSFFLFYFFIFFNFF